MTADTRWQAHQCMRCHRWECGPVRSEAGARCPVCAWHELKVIKFAEHAGSQVSAMLLEPWLQIGRQINEEAVRAARMHQAAMTGSNPLLARQIGS